MKGHLHSRMEVLPQPVDILGIKVMFSLGLRKYFLKENFKRKLSFPILASQFKQERANDI